MCDDHLVYIQKYNFLSKNCRGYFLATQGKFWATFYTNICSHWLQQQHQVFTTWKPHFCSSLAEMSEMLSCNWIDFRFVWKKKMNAGTSLHKWPGMLFCLRPGINTMKQFCRNWTDVKLQQHFDVLCEMLSEFSSGHICACYKGLGYFQLDGANLQMQTQLVPKIMHQK